MKAWVKVDKFYLVLGLVLILMAALVIYTFRSVFSALSLSYEVEVEVPDSELRIDKESLEKANELVFDKEIATLEVQ